MRKLYEFMSPDQGGIQVLQEANGKDLCMQGLFIQGDVQNHNGRVYPSSEIATAVKSIQERISNGETVLGELDHPEELQINLDRVSHIITEMKTEGANGLGKLKIINTPTGQIARSLIEGGARLGVSSRGSGNVDGSGNVSDFDIITVDIVAQASAPSAYPKPIYESLFNMRGGAIIYETAKEAVHEQGAQNQLAHDIIRLINELKL